MPRFRPAAALRQAVRSAPAGAGRRTEAGVKLAEQTVDLVIESEQKALLDFSVEEQAQLLTLTRRYNEALKTLGINVNFKAIAKTGVKPLIASFIASIILVLICWGLAVLFF